MAVKDKNKKQPEVKVKTKKETILVEVTKDMKNFLEEMNGSEFVKYHDKKVLKTMKKFGKTYLVVDNK